MNPFWKNTKNGSKEPQPTKASPALSIDGSDKAAEAAARLGEELEAAKDARKEERFVWIVIVTILLDVLWFSDSENPTLPVIVLVLQLIVLVILARRMGIDDVVELIDRLLHTVGSKAGSGN